MITRAVADGAVSVLRPHQGWLQCVLIVVLLLGTRLLAHPGFLTSAVANVRRDGHVEVELTFDLLAFALNDEPQRIPDAAMVALLEGPPAELERCLRNAQRRFDRHFRLWVDGREMRGAPSEFPSVDDVHRRAGTGPTPRLPVVLSCRVTGQLPAGARTIAFSFPDLIGSVVLTVERPSQEPTAESVPAGERSTRIAIGLRPGADGGARAAQLEPGRMRGDGPPAAARRTAPASLGSLPGFVRLGFEHIVPRGLDHLLFVLGLFLLGGRLGTLLWQVTAFTVAHSITLALSLYGVVRLPAALVEPLIAASIVLVACDNLRGGGLRWWRVVVVFGFGLVHGLGFAGALQALELPRREFLGALVGFNLGVELGQLAVIGLAFAAVGWCRSRSSYRRFVVAPASVGIAAVALVWTVQRVAG